MRMEGEGPSAADFLNTADESMIADVIFALGEEPKARRIARAIVHARPIERNGQLADIVRKATGHRPGEPKDQIGRAACRESGCPYGWLSGDAVPQQKKK